MKFPRCFLFLILVFQAGCTSSESFTLTPTATLISKLPINKFATETISITAKPSVTMAVTATATATEIPTIPVTAVLDLNCPKGDPNLILSFITNATRDIPEFESAILNFLNSGGMPGRALDTLKNEYDFEQRYLGEADLTGDNLPELVIGNRWLFVFGCDSNLYRVIMKGKPGTCGFSPCSPSINYIGDMNQNGVSEIIISRKDAVNKIDRNYYQILEWDGKQFVNLVKNSNSHSCIGPELHDVVQEDEICIQPIDELCYLGCIQDIDGNGTLEFILEGLYPGSQQTLVDVYMWDGTNFVFYSSTPSE